MANWNKKVSEIIDKAWQMHALKGYWPRAQYSESERGISFSLFPRMESEKLYYYAVHEFLKSIGIEEGIYTKKRNEALFSKLREFIEKEPMTVKNLKVGQTLKGEAIPDISKKYREGDISSLDMLGDNIVDMTNCKEEHGYQDTYGSWYVSDIRLVKNEDGHWQVFDWEYDASLAK